MWGITTAISGARFWHVRLDGLCCLIMCICLIAIPPKYAASQVIGFIKGKSAPRLACRLGCTGSASRILLGSIFGLGGTVVSTVGREETVIREYIQSQEQEDVSGWIISDLGR